MERRVHMQLGGFVTVDAQVADECAVRCRGEMNGLNGKRSSKNDLLLPLTAAQIDQVRDVQVLVIDEGGVHTRTRPVIDAEVVQMRIAAEQIAFFVVDHQLLDELVVFGDVQVVAGRRLAGPAR